MAVYVDDAEIVLGYTIASRLWADTPEELHAMCDKLGIPEKYRDTEPGKEGRVLVSRTRRKLALRLGAKPVDELEYAFKIARARGQHKTLERLVQARIDLLRRGPLTP